MRSPCKGGNFPAVEGIDCQAGTRPEPPALAVHS